MCQGTLFVNSLHPAGGGWCGRSRCRYRDRASGGQEQIPGGMLSGHCSIKVWAQARTARSFLGRAVPWGVRMMGGGPRTFPGGVSKWQWKRMQEKKQQQIEKARLLRDRQLYEARRRAELMASSPQLEKPWETSPSSSPAAPSPPPSALPPPDFSDPHIRALASRFNKGGSMDLWTRFDGPEYSDDDGEAPAAATPLSSARLLPRKAAKPTGEKKRGSPSAAASGLAAPGTLFPDSKRLRPRFLQEKAKQIHTQAKDLAPEPDGDEDAASPSHLSQTRFDSFPISPLSIQALHTVLKYERMTVVQEQTLPLILDGVDLLAKAKTGTGKTIAFLLPAIEAILKGQVEGQVGGKSINVLVICPTRELASQAAAEATTLTKFHSGIGALVVIGGTNMSSELSRINRLPCQILVGTPGRLVDHIQSSDGFAQRLRGLKVLVLDEADQLLDMGFRKSLDTIIAALPRKRQTLLFSATIPKEVHSVTEVALKKNHVFVDTVGEEDQETHARVTQTFMVAPLEQQIGVAYTTLMEHIAEEPNYKVLVFCTTARSTQLMAELHRELGLNVREIHSRKSQAFRTRTSDEFRKSQGGIVMFTSDVSARGVDYPDVTLVLQVGLPAGREQYIHRLGRTGRAGKEGQGVLLLTPWEETFIKQLKDISISAAPLPRVTSDTNKKLQHALAKISNDTREKAYAAWLGYYNSAKNLSWNKETLVQRANLFSSTIGLDAPPYLTKKTVQMMGLRGVPGLNVQ